MRFYDIFVKGQEVDGLWKDIIHSHPWVEMKKFFSKDEPVEIPRVVGVETTKVRQ